MTCLAPVKLKSGLTVPCGRCLNCLSDRRNEWSIRLAIHTEFASRMPLFLTLTYDNEHLPLIAEDGEVFRICDEGKDAEAILNLYLAGLTPYVPTVSRKDASAFLKEYKRKYSLDNSRFTYFGCSEYGDTFGRPHIHLLFFGDDELSQMFDQDSQLANDRVKVVWKFGDVHICVAGYDGIHYVTKYCLKDSESNDSKAAKPFTIASKGLGNSFFDSVQFSIINHKLEMLKLYFNDIFDRMPVIDYDDKDSIKIGLEYWQKYIPKFEVNLSDGRTVFLPRTLRKRCIGSFENWKDNPLWVFNLLKQLLASIEYYEQNGEYDATAEVTTSVARALHRADRIRQRLAIRRCPKKDIVSLKPDIKL